MVGSCRKEAVIHPELGAARERLALGDERLLNGAIGIEDDL